MRIATWNVNSVRARLPRLLPWLQEYEPEILCLQETKVVDQLFPREPLEDEGYNIVPFGQKTYNGVAILSRYPIEDVIRGFPDDGESADKRLLGCIIQDFMILNVYVPNGREVGHEKYHSKLAWLKRLRQLLDERYDVEEKLVVTGDFNVTFDDRDVYDPEAWREKILCSTPEREAMAEVMGFGLKDALRHFTDERDIYTWWDFRTRGFQRNHGLRIDHFLVSPKALKACKGVEVDMQAREGQAPSDHAPVVATFR